MQVSLNCLGWFAITGAEMSDLSGNQMLVSPYSEQAGDEWLCSVLGRPSPGLPGCQVEGKGQLCLYKSIITLAAVSSLWWGKVIGLHVSKWSYSQFVFIMLLMRNSVMKMHNNSWFCILPTTIKCLDGRTKLLRATWRHWRFLAVWRTQNMP